MRAGVKTAVDCFQIEDVTRLEPGGNDVDLVESGRLDVLSLISRRISLDDAGEALTSPANDAIRSVVI